MHSIGPSAAEMISQRKSLFDIQADWPLRPSGHFVNYLAMIAFRRGVQDFNDVLTRVNACCVMT